MATPWSARRWRAATPTASTGSSSPDRGERANAVLGRGGDSGLPARRLGAMRVIAGEAKGRRLTAPRSAGRAAGLRPTTDRLREALFNALGPGIAGKAVLDLYAGTGALGIEALSRGAARAVFVDSDRQAVATIRANLATTGLEARARVEHTTAERFAARPASAVSPPPATYGLVLLDPPYSAGFPAPVVAALAAGGHLAPGGLVVVEVAAAAPVGDGSGLQVVDHRRYGDSALVFLRAAEAVSA
ncbi:MAG TPA: 16S rRNA (guanine(966)-N(2))-methyltransferase RsmD [Actinomycetota bacterium]|nr:16S rRNA (guanine(966)-N(2))-methyltransferase RsmD [Actinomycetota bacterium]